MHVASAWFCLAAFLALPDSQKPSAMGRCTNDANVRSDAKGRAHEELEKRLRMLGRGTEVTEEGTHEGTEVSCKHVTNEVKVGLAGRREADLKASSQGWLTS